MGHLFERNQKLIAAIGTPEEQRGMLAEQRGTAAERHGTVSSYRQFRLDWSRVTEVSR